MMSDEMAMLMISGGIVFAMVMFVVLMRKA